MERAITIVSERGWKLELEGDSFYLEIVDDSNTPPFRNKIVSINNPIPLHPISIWKCDVLYEKDFRVRVGEVLFHIDIVWHAASTSSWKVSDELDWKFWEKVCTFPKPIGRLAYDISLQ